MGMEPNKVGGDLVNKVGQEIGPTVPAVAGTSVEEPTEVTVERLLKLGRRLAWVGTGIFCFGLGRVDLQTGCFNPFMGVGAVGILVGAFLYGYAVTLGVQAVSDEMDAWLQEEATKGAEAAESARE